jgi:hypothetical protein
VVPLLSVAEPKGKQQGQERNAWGVLRKSVSIGAQLGYFSPFV